MKGTQAQAILFGSVVLGLVIWLFALLAKDPNGVLTEMFKNKKGK